MFIKYFERFSKSSAGDNMQPLIFVNEAIEIEGFHNIYYFEFDKHHAHPLEKHNFWEMVYVDMGEIIAVNEDGEENLKSEQVVFRSPGEPHAHISNLKSSNNLLVVSFSCNSPSMEFFKKNKTFSLDKTAKTLLTLFTKEAKNALGGIPNHFKDHSPLDFSDETFGASQLMKAHFTEFLIKLIRSSADLTEDKYNRELSKDNKAELIENYMREHIYEDLTLNDLCNIFFLRKSQLSSVFKEFNGTSPMKYFLNLKIEEAKKLLRDNELSVSEIAYKLNFSDIYSFSRAFKNATGFSPSQYKKSISDN